MVACHVWESLALVIVIGLQSPVEKSDKAASGPATDVNTMEVRFADDTTVKAVLLDKSVVVATRFGKLTVPTSEIRRIKFGLRIRAQTLRRIDEGVAQLGSVDFKQREAASAELLKLRELAYPAIKKAVKSSDAEVARRAGELVKALEEKLPADKLLLKDYDTIVTDEFTIVGQIEATSFKARSTYFGDVQLPLAELRSLRGPGNGREAELSVDAAKYGGQQEAWLDTGIEVTSGMNLEITAGGAVDLWPLPGGVGQYMSGPDGYANAGGFPRGFLPGALVGRVGERGKPFLVGQRHRVTTEDDGKLYLRIMPSPWNNPSTGSYDVKITTAR